MSGEQARALEAHEAWVRSIGQIERRGSRLLLAKATFTGAVLRGRDLSECELVECNFDGADLAGSSLHSACLADCSLVGADLSEVQAARPSCLTAGYGGPT